jgi:PAS domain S-box-containing protein
VAGEGRVAVLLVDDRPENLVALEAMLSDMPDVSLAKAASGQDALRSVLREDFAAILMDVQMPGMDGFETAELIRANPKTRHMPIIFVTAGMGDADSRQQAYRQGAVDFLTKPLEPAIVRSKVRVFCDLYAQRQMIAQHGEQMEALVANRTTALQRSNVELALERDRYREMSAKFELATSGARLGVWDCARMHELYGLAPADFGGDHASWIACVHPDDRTFCEASIRRALQREREYDIEFRICRPDGAVRHIKASAHVVFDDKGRALRMTGINQDITDIKQIEQEVRAHRDRLLELVDEKTASLRAVVDHAAEGIITTDSTGVILGFNLAAERMFGHAAAAVIGRRVNVLMPSPHDGQHESYIQRYLGGASSQIVGTGREAVGLRADGSIFPIYIAVSEFAVGGELRFAAIVHDISKQKALEANLVHAREVAEAANQAKGSFLANMSHEIRTPLNAIIGLAHLLRWSGLTVEQRERLGKIDSAANHLLSVINDILDLSKIDAGKLELEHVDFGLGAVLEYVRSLISDQAQAKGLTVARVAARRPDAPAPGAAELRQQRCQVRRARCYHAVRGGAGGLRRQPAGALHGAGRRHRHRRRQAVPRVPCLRAGRHLDLAQVWRHRVGPGHHAAPCRDDGRRGWREERARRRQPFLVHRPPGPRARGHAAGGACARVECRIGIAPSPCRCAAAAGRRPPGQPGGGAGAAALRWPVGGRGGRWPRGGGQGARERLRPDPDGCADASDGWLGGDPRDPLATGACSDAGAGDDRQRIR